MAKDLQGNEVKVSCTTKFLVVKNQNAHAAADSFYITVRGEFNDKMLRVLREAIVPQFADDHERLEIAFPKDGKITLLFTQEDIIQALIRAAKNPEDVPESRTIWDWVKELFN